MIPPTGGLFRHRTYSCSLVYAAYRTSLIAVVQAHGKYRLTINILKKCNKQNK